MKKCMHKWEYSLLPNSPHVCYLEAGHTDKHECHICNEIEGEGE